MAFGRNTFILLFLLILPGPFYTGCDRKTPSRSISTYDLTPALAKHVRVEGACAPGNPGCQHLLGTSWYPPERSVMGHDFAWTKGTVGRLDLPIARSGAGLLVVRGQGLDDRQGPRNLNVTINGHDLGRAPLPASAGNLRFAVKAGIIIPGLNEVVLATERFVRPLDLGRSSDDRELGFRIEWVRFLSNKVLATKNEDSLLTNPFGANADAILDHLHSIHLQPAHLAGAVLLLNWEIATGDPGDIVALSLTAAPFGRPILSKNWPTDSEMPLRIPLPADLPPKLWLNLALTGTDNGVSEAAITLTSAALEWKFRPLTVILIVVDTLRPDYLGCYGAHDDASPNIDGLAEDGILFETAVCHSPITGPSHACLFASRLPTETGVINNSRNKIPAGIPLLAEFLQERGYDSGAAISISPIAERYGFGRGFETYSDSLGHSWIINADEVLPRSLEILSGLESPLFLWAHFSDPHEPYDAHGLVEHQAEILVAGRRVRNVSTSTYSPTVLDLDLPPGETEVVLRSEYPFVVRNLALRSRTGKPPLLEPETPPQEETTEYHATLLASDTCNVHLVVALADRVSNQNERHERYAREVAFTDRHVGGLLTALRTSGLYDESLIIFTSDHGEALGCHGFIGHIETVYDCMVRVPLIVKPPLHGEARGGTRRSDLASLVDILPTVLGQLELEPPSWLRGRDLISARANETDPVVFLETHPPEASRTLYGLRGSRYKIIWSPESDGWEFYDLKEDPGEMSNLFDPGQELVLSWQRRLEALLANLNLAKETENTDLPLDARTEEMLKSLGY